jgi:hypothetical protein
MKVDWFLHSVPACFAEYFVTSLLCNELQNMNRLCFQIGLIDCCMRSEQ